MRDANTRTCGKQPCRSDLLRNGEIAGHAAGVNGRTGLGALQVQSAKIKFAADKESLAYGRVVAELDPTGKSIQADVALTDRGDRGDAGHGEIASRAEHRRRSCIGASKGAADVRSKIEALPIVSFSLAEAGRTQNDHEHTTSH